jgi:hypothetical protein
MPQDQSREQERAVENHEAAEIILADGRAPMHKSGNRKQDESLCKEQMQ